MNLREQYNEAHETAVRLSNANVAGLSPAERRQALEFLAEAQMRVQALGQQLQAQLTPAR